MALLGKMHDVTSEFACEVKDFFSIREEADKYYYSPSVSFAGSSWYLKIYLHGSQEYNSIGYVGLFLCKKDYDDDDDDDDDDAPITLAWSLSLKTSNGTKSNDMHCTHTFNKNSDGYGWSKFVKRSTLLEQRSELVPSDVLTIIFTVEFYSVSTDEVDRIVTIPRCSYCKKGLDVKYVSSHEETCLKRPITCPTCKEALALRKWPKHECAAVAIKANEVINDFARILETEDHSDFTIEVKDTEFQLHKSILAARNPYFSAMFKAKMKEEKTSMLSIDDCEPSIFRSFIYFVYTGKLETLSHDNVCALYEVADKYQQDALKAECLRFMKEKVGVESFCNFIVLALKYDQGELLQSATNLFCRKTKEIILTAKWQTFLREYPTQSNELYVKALDFNAK